MDGKFEDMSINTNPNVECKILVFLMRYFENALLLC